MDPHAYLTEIKAKLIALLCVVSVVAVEERLLPDRGYFRARAEYFVVEEGRCKTKRYRYQWMDSSQQILRKRWDNVEHFPELANFPHHIHVSEETNVEPGRSLSIIELMDLIEEAMNT